MWQCVKGSAQPLAVLRTILNDTRHGFSGGFWAQAERLSASWLTLRHSGGPLYDPELSMWNRGCDAGSIYDRRRLGLDFTVEQASSSLPMTSGVLYN
jgi:hypothetical protein